MKKKLIGYLYFIAGILNIIASIFNFSDNKILGGVTYLFIGIIFIVLGLLYRNKTNR